MVNIAPFKINFLVSRRLSSSYKNHNSHNSRNRHDNHNSHNSLNSHNSKKIQGLQKKCTNRTKSKPKLSAVRLNFTMNMTWEGLIRLSLSKKRPKE